MRNHSTTSFLLAFSLVFWLSTASASEGSAEKDLKKFLHQIQTMYTQFDQKQWPAGRKEPDVQKGQLLFQQPNKFHWVYSAPFKQEYIADGETVRIYDQDLEQGIIRAQKDFTGFIFSDLFNQNYPVEEYFEVAVSKSEETKTFKLTTRDVQNSPIQQINFILQKGVLSSIEILDALNQLTLIELYNLKINPPVLERSFQFEWPVGIDVFDERKTAE